MFGFTFHCIIFHSNGDTSPFFFFFFLSNCRNPPHCLPEADGRALRARRVARQQRGGHKRAANQRWPQGAQSAVLSEPVTFINYHRPSSSSSTMRSPGTSTFFPFHLSLKKHERRPSISAQRIRMASQAVLVAPSLCPFASCQIYL